MDSGRQGIASWKKEEKTVTTLFDLMERELAKNPQLLTAYRNDYDIHDKQTLREDRYNDWLWIVYDMGTWLYQLKDKDRQWLIDRIEYLTNPRQQGRIEDDPVAPHIYRLQIVRRGTRHIYGTVTRLSWAEARLLARQAARRCEDGNISDGRKRP
jgi:hypothetical protein